jgi:Flp pilus assembly protein TadD
VDETELANLISIYESGRLDEAASLCREILSREPDQLEATYLLGRIQLDRSDSASAVAMLRRAAKLAPDWPEVQANLGAALFMRGKLDEAAYHIRRAAALDPEDAEAQNNLGFVLQAAGRAREAEAAFLRALELRPDYPEALSNLGGTLQAVGRRSEAMERFRKALMLGSQNPEVLSALGEACLAAGDLDAAEGEFGRLLTMDPASSRALAGLAGVQAARTRAASASECVRIGAESLERDDVGTAETAFRQALAGSPENSDALKGLAEALVRTRRPEQAIPILEGLAAISGADADLLNSYGVALRETGEARKAAEQFRRAVEIAPDHRKAVANLALALADIGNAAEAVPLCRRALELWPENAELHNALGVALSNRERYDEAIPAFTEALRIDPGLALAWMNLGVLRCRQNREILAVRPFRRALAIKPELEQALNFLAAIYVSRGRSSAGEELLRRAAACSSNPGEMRARLALCLLAREQYEEGWSEYECRLQMPSNKLKISAPRWQGESDPSGTLLVHFEQAYGDNIQFVRYLYALKRRWQGSIHCYTDPALFPLFEASGLPARILSLPCFGAAPCDIPYPGEGYDAFVSLMSLPAHFHTVTETIPADVPYLRAPEDRVTRWREALDEGSELRVGLTWSGRRDEFYRNRRSCDLPQLAPLAGIAGVRFYSLQVGSEARQIEDAPAGLDIVDLGKEIQDFADTAAILQQLDLLISIDSAPAHVAGALGRPVWTLLPFVADWRWLTDREDSPWYPTMRLFRQPKVGAWEPVWDRVAQELRNLVECGRSPGG